MIQSTISIFYSDRILILIAFMISVACNDVDFRLDTGYSCENVASTTLLNMLDSILAVKADSKGSSSWIVQG